MQQNNVNLTLEIRDLGWKKICCKPSHHGSQLEELNWSPLVDCVIDDRNSAVWRSRAFCGFFGDPYLEQTGLEGGTIEALGELLDILDGVIIDSTNFQGRELQCLRVAAADLRKAVT